MIRRLLIFAVGLSLFLTNDVLAQVPQGMSYQSVVRNSSGAPQLSTPVALRFSILQGSATGTAVYVETQNFTTNAQGVVTGTIGTVTPTQGVFSTIDWGSGTYFLKVEANINNQGYSLSGTSPIVSVPYALTAGSLAAKGGTSGNVLSWDGSSSNSSGALFEVKDKNGNPIFSVYPTGVEVVYDETAPVRGAKGGFAVSGRNSTRGIKDVLRVTTDSTIVYVNTDATRGAKGGFAISGRNSTRLAGKNILFSVDSKETSIINNDSTKGLNLTRPLADGTSESYLNITPKNCFIGNVAGKSILEGRHNIFIGDSAGAYTTGEYMGDFMYNGSDNIFIGRQAGLVNTFGSGNVFIGQRAGADLFYSSNTFIVANGPTPLIFGDFNSGNVGIGVNDPTASLDVGGNLRVRGLAPTVISPLSIDTDGTIVVGGGSDVRLKTNIEPLPYGLQSVLKLRGVTYNWKKLPNDIKRVGFIAQEVEAVIPELVYTNKNDGMKGINYPEMTAVLVEAVKDQQKIIEELKSENELMKKQMEEIKQMVLDMKK